MPSPSRLRGTGGSGDENDKAKTLGSRLTTTITAKRARFKNGMQMIISPRGSDKISVF